MANWDNPHFRSFAQSLEALLMGYGSSDEDFTAKQKRQVESLVALEAAFRQALIRDPKGPDAYRMFLSFILDERRNILAARPYFRERQSVFKEEISPLLRERKDKALYKFNINYPFIAFVMKRNKFAKKSEVYKLSKKVEDSRRELIEVNMPLAISRASLFRRMTPQSHLEHMDLIQISNEGLIAAVDKFVLPYTPVFRAVIIGRISGNLIEDYSETLLHFYPSDKRKIYKANKIRGSSDEIHPDDIADKVNEGTEDSHKTNSAEIQQLLAAASHISIDAPPPETSLAVEGEPESAIDKYAADDSFRPDVRYEEAEVRSVLKRKLAALPLFERKLLRMKGLEL